ncbi:unnamed protein product [Blepharisma stoltei]|uniref:MICOS complex subunit MIC10 n=1 Tax=Blepharisma stoltei TaxID=1481888 RepID=A0AAU9JPW1_9CILI|nr:unnamed protein product [Blepharisma stoltei]
MEGKTSHAESCIKAIATNAAIGGLVGLGLGLILAKTKRLPFVLYGAGFGTGITKPKCEPLMERMKAKVSN